MPSNVISRETIRDKWAELATASLVTSLGIVSAVYNYQAGNFGGRSPIVRVLVGGSNRQQSAMGVTTQSDSQVQIQFEIFVKKADSGVSWSEPEVDDALDDVEKAVADLIADNRQIDNFWDYAEQTEGLSVITPFQDIGGNPYLREIIPVLVKVYHA